MNPHLDDTIVAVSTPPGRGGIGVARLAGGQAVEIARKLAQASSGDAWELEAGRAKYALLIDENGERIDEVVVTYFQAPHSYTSEDIVEISAHGSPVVLRHIVERAVELGARTAEPGEFTMRAFLKGRIDLTQAEAVRDLIDSQTLFQAKAAAQQLDGAVSKRVQPTKKDLMQLIAALEAGVDFAEDDVAVMSGEHILAGIAELRAPLETLSASIGYGKLVHDGLTLAIVGRPNVGKSSLFNRLIDREHAIVTATPGTTRDLVSETVSLEGIPVKLIDTAGLRESQDEAEQIGVKKSYEALAKADVVLLVVEAADADNEQDEVLLRDAKLRGAESIVVENKADLLHERFVAGLDDRVRTSALRGDGISELREAIVRRVIGQTATVEPGFLTNERQHAAVKDGLRALESAQEAVLNNMPHEVLLLDLYAALKALDALTGATSTDDILSLIFAGFCIGK